LFESSQTTVVHIPVNLFPRYEIELSGRVLKTSTCESCNVEYVYDVTGSAVGRVTSPLDVLTSRYVNRLLKAQAKKRLARIFKNPDFVACPVCGWYQADMVRHLRKQRLKKGIFTTALATFVILAVVFGLAHVAGYPLLVATVAAAGAFGAGVVCTVWHATRDPNDVAREADRAERANQSRGLTIEEYRRREQQEQAEREAREATLANVITREQADKNSSDARSDALAPPDDDGFSFSELGRAAQKASRQRQERKEQARRGKARQVYAIVVGALAGAIMDAIFSGIDADELSLRIVATLFLGIGCGLFGYAMTLRYSVSILTKHASTKASPLDIALYVSALTAGLPATWAAAGMERATLRGYAYAVGCEIVAIFLVWQLGRTKPKGDT
jgi:hypothetical protein